MCTGLFPLCVRLTLLRDRPVLVLIRSVLLPEDDGGDNGCENRVAPALFDDFCILLGFPLERLLRSFAHIKSATEGPPLDWSFFGEESRQE